MKHFFIGWHQPVNGFSGCHHFDRCMISVNRLLTRKSHFPVNEWIMDSGAFTRIRSGVGHLPIKEYAALILKWAQCGKLLAAVTQDFMCEKFILNKTGLTVKQHQDLTIQNYDALLKEVGKKVYIMPVLQGYTVQEYLNHLNDYGDRLKKGQWVGVGSVCKRISVFEIENILFEIKCARPDLKLHGFGVKKKALCSPVVRQLLHSSDSAASGLKGGKGSNKCVGSNDPLVALAYANEIKSLIRKRKNSEK